MKDLNKLETLYKIWYDSEEDTIEEICIKLYDLDNNVGRYYSGKVLNARFNLEKYRIANEWFIDLKSNIKSKIANNLEVLEQINDIIESKM